MRALSIPTFYTQYAEVDIFLDRWAWNVRVETSSMHSTATANIEHVTDIPAPMGSTDASFVSFHLQNCTRYCTSLIGSARSFDRQSDL